MPVYTYLLESTVGQANGACPLGAGGTIASGYIADVPAASLDSTGSVNGTILTANGSGGASYASLAVAPKFSPFLLMGIGT